MGVEDEDIFSSLNLKCQSSENGKIQQMHNHHLTSKLCRDFRVVDKEETSMLLTLWFVVFISKENSLHG